MVLHRQVRHPDDVGVQDDAGAVGREVLLRAVAGEADDVAPGGHRLRARQAEPLALRPEQEDRGPAELLGDLGLGHRVDEDDLPPVQPAGPAHQLNGPEEVLAAAPRHQREPRSLGSGRKYSSISTGTRWIGKPGTQARSRKVAIASDTASTEVAWGQPG